MIGAIQNKHIAPLQWYYYSKDDKMLVYNIFPMGSLADALHGYVPLSGPNPLDWERRAAVSLAAARGVAYIHSAGPSSCHGNIKSCNVMLTGTHGACVSVTGKAPVYDKQLEDGVDLPQWVCSVAREEWTARVIDVALLARQHKYGEEKCMVRLLQLAIHCCSEDANLRPTMSDVVQRIEKIPV